MTLQPVCEQTGAGHLGLSQGRQNGYKADDRSTDEACCEDRPVDSTPGAFGTGHRRSGPGHTGTRQRCADVLTGNSGPLWASFTPLDYGWLAWISLVPLLQLVRIERKTRWMYSSIFVSGFVWSICTLQWMRLGDPVMIRGWAALAIYMGFYFPCFVATARCAVYRFGFPMVVAVPLVWVGLEYLRATLMTGFAWYFLGHTQWAWTELIQISDLTGAYGVSFIVAASAACLSGLIPLPWLERLRLFPPVQVPKQFEHLPAGEIIAENAGRAEFRHPWRHVGFTIGLVTVSLCYGTVRRGQAEFVDGPRVALIQGNFPSSLKHDPAAWERIFRIHHNQLTMHAVQQQPDLIVWPETMFRVPLQVLDDDVTESDLASLSAPPIEWWKSQLVQNRFRTLLLIFSL